MEKYEAIEQIGEGSFGKVFRAKRIEDNVFVALKFVPKLGRSEREINSLRQECEIQKNLIHSNIIHMLDSFETDKFVVVVTEYAARGELSSLLEKDRRLSISKVQTIAVDLVSALNYLHSRRILHRDMKPQNILIGSDGFYKLCDFGFARTMGIDTYMLTSIKGTPLYMAPEIIEEKPYDHNADLWSLGCILYELLVGKPPFFTKSLFQLVTMIRNDSIVYPEFVSGDCLSFLKGLLEKTPQKRLTWPQLLIHPFVRDGVRVENNSTGEFSLTKALSPSQEIAKESQRQHLQKKLTGYSKLLIKTARKLEDAQRKLDQYGGDGKPVLIKTSRTSPGVTKAQPKSPSSGKSPKTVSRGTTQVDQQQPSESPEQVAKTSNQNDVKQVTARLKNMNLKAKKSEEKIEGNVVSETDGGSGSSCETLTSSSGDEDESDDDGNNTVILGRLKKNRSVEERELSSREKLLEEEDTKEGFAKDKHGGDGDKRAGADGGSQTLWKSGALFTLHSFGSEDKPLHSEEWLFFLIKTMKEVIETPTSLCEKHFLSIFVGPLRNHLAGPEVVEKIAALFSIPFSIESDLNTSQPGLLLSLQTIYLESKVVPNLLYSCKLIVRRRRLERGSVELNEIAAILTAEDLDALDKCLRLVCCLVHSDEDFVNQFCDSVCVLQLFPILQLFLKLDKRKSRLASDTLAILCHVMRIIPSNASILEELFLIIGSNGSEESCEEFWRILRHSNPVIKSRALRIMSYLAVNSENTRDKIIRKNCAKIWKLLRESSLSMDPKVREAAGFAMQSLKCLSSVKTTCTPVTTATDATTEVKKTEQMNSL